MNHADSQTLKLIAKNLLEECRVREIDAFTLHQDGRPAVGEETRIILRTSASVLAGIAMAIINATKPVSKADSVAMATDSDAGSR